MVSKLWTMTSKERTEIKEIFREAILPFEVRIESEVSIIDIRLSDIDEHLKKLNGTMANHDKMLNAHIPGGPEGKRSIDQCPQNEVINDLKENMINAKAIKKTIISAVAVTGTLFSIAFIIYRLLTNK